MSSIIRKMPKEYFKNAKKTKFLSEWVFQKHKLFKMLRNKFRNMIFMTTKWFLNRQGLINPLFIFSHTKPNCVATE